MTRHDVETKPARILVVDDEAIQRALTRDSLEKAGLEVEEAASGEEALACIAKSAPDLVLLDIIMPGIDGFEVCRALRAEPSTRHLPVVVVTGCDSPDDINAGMEAGANDFLTKPLNWDLLANRVRYVLRTSRLERDMRGSRDMMKRALSMKSNLLRMMSHELRTPLNAIIGFSSLIRDHKTEQEKHNSDLREYASYINVAGVRLLDTINAILDINEIEAGIENFQTSDFALQDLISSALNKARLHHPDKDDISVELALVDPALNLRVDGARMVQCLFQLISNALKFNVEGGWASISADWRKTGEFAIEIRDSGIGVSERDLLRVLTPFEQSDNRLSRNFEGMGVGLPHARSIINLHGGTLSFDSRLSEGTLIRLAFPANIVSNAHAPLLAARAS